MATIAGAGLGRVLDVVTLAGGKGFSLKNANAVSFVCYSPNNNGVFTLTIAKTYSGAYAQNSIKPFTYWYSQTAADGTGQWSRQTLAAGNAVTVSGAIVPAGIPLFATAMPDGYHYVKLPTSVDASATVTAVLHDLAVGRKPANLAILGA